MAYTSLSIGKQGLMPRPKGHQTYTTTWISKTNKNDKYSVLNTYVYGISRAGAVLAKFTNAAITNTVLEPHEL